MTINPPGGFGFPAIDYSNLDYTRLDYTKIDPAKLDFGAIITAHGLQVEAGDTAIALLLRKYFPRLHNPRNVVLMAPGDSGDEKPEMFVYRPPTQIRVDKKMISMRDPDSADAPNFSSNDDDSGGPDTRTVVFGRVSAEVLVELQNLARYTDGDELELYARKPFWPGDVFIEPDTNSPHWERIVANAESE